MKYFVYLLVLASSITACEKSTDSACTEVAYEQIFEVQAGQQFCFPDGMEVTIDALVNNFCPCDATCIWSGEMLVQMRIALAGEEAIEYTYHSERQDTTLDLQLFEIESFDIEFETACDEQNPSPEIEFAELKISKR